VQELAISRLYPLIMERVEWATRVLPTTGGSPFDCEVLGCGLSPCHRHSMGVEADEEECVSIAMGIYK
jgi:hypothetical protein